MEKERRIACLLAALLFCLSVSPAMGAGVLVLPQGLKEIGAEAFEGDTSLGEVVLPEGVVEIGSRAFAGSSLTSISMPKSVATIADDAFDACSNELVMTGYTGSEAERYALSKGISFKGIAETAAEDFLYTIKGDRVTITGYTGSDTDIVIPRYIEGKPVTAIGAYAFENASVKRVVLQAGVTSIAKNAFYWCGDLQEVHVPGSVTSISYDAFLYTHSDLKLVGQEDSFAQNYAWDNAIGFVDEATGETLFDRDLAYRVENGKAVITKYTGDDERLVIPASIDGYAVSRVQSNALKQADRLLSVTFEARITRIETALMFGCDLLEYVSLPDSVTSIEKEAFKYCYALEQIDIPAGVTSIAADAFAFCDHLTICGEVGSYAQTYAQENGISFRTPDAVQSEFAYIRQEGMAVITGYKGTEAEIEIPAEIGHWQVAIGAHAFAGNTTITGVTISNGIEEIGSSAFEGCTNLASLSLGSSVAQIGSRAFASCGKLTEVIMPEGVTEIEAGTFEACTNLNRVVLPETLKVIGDYAFAGCAALTEMEIPTSVTTIGSYAYANAAMLRSVCMPATVTVIGAGAFDGVSAEFSMMVDEGSYARTYALANGLVYRINTPYTYSESDGKITITGYDLSMELGEDVIIPATVDGMPVTAIGDGAFTWNSYVTISVTLPPSVTHIGARAFTGLGALERIFGSGVTSIGEQAFNGCNNLMEAPIQEGLAEIGTYAFAYCMGLKEVELPSSLKTIGEQAFIGCSGIKTVVVSADPVSCGKGIFKGCAGITGVEFKSGITVIPEKMFEDCQALVSVTLPETIVDIGVSAFYGAKALKSVDWPSALAHIGDEAFKNTGLESLVLPENVSIGSGAFSGSSISALVIPQNVAAMGAGAFMDCTNLTDITFPAQQIELGRYLFSGCTALESVDLPSAWTSLPVGLFSGCTALREIILPSDVQSIPDDMFKDCNALENVEFGSKVRQIGDYVFRNCQNLKTIDLPKSLYSLGEGVFYQSGLTQVVIPDSVSAIGADQFYYCSDLERVELGTGVKRLTEYMLTGCQKLRAVVLKGDVTRIDTGFMAGLSGNIVIYYVSMNNAIRTLQGYGFPVYPLRDNSKNFEFELARDALSMIVTAYTGTAKTVHIPYEHAEFPVTGIGAGAFKNSAVEEIVLPDCVTDIGARAFEGCKDLQKINFPALISSIGTGAFKGCIALERVELAGTQIIRIEDQVFSEVHALERITLPDELEAIGAEAFYNCPLLVHLNLPGGLKELGRGALGLTGIQEISIPSGLTSLSDAVFAGTNLKEITIPTTITSIGDRAFASCEMLRRVTIPGSVRTIGDQAFKDCFELRRVQIMNGTETIGERAFANCYTDIAVYVPVSVSAIGANLISAVGDSAIYGYAHSYAESYAAVTGLPFVAIEDGAAGDYVFRVENHEAIVVEYVGEETELSIPDTLGGYPVVAIDEGAFDGREELTYIGLPSGLQRIGGCAFRESGIVQINLPESLKRIGDGAFSSCRNLVEIRILDGVDEIGEAAFEGCSQMTRAEIGSGIRYIDAYTFCDCSNLTDVVLPDDLLLIGGYAFNGCSSLKKIDLPDSIESIAQYAFGGTDLGSIALPKNMSDVSPYILYPCHDLIYVEIGSGTKKIYDDAFAGCANLIRIMIPDSVTEIAEGAFAKNLAGLTVYGYAGSAAQTYAQDRGWEFYVLNNTTDFEFAEENGEVVLKKYLGKKSFVFVPEKYKGMPVVRIAPEAFSGNLDIVRVVIPESVVNIDGNAFKNCMNLYSVLIRNQNAKLGAAVFSGCTSLEEITLPQGLTNIPAETFRYCASLKDINLPEKCTKIDIRAFGSCVMLEDIHIPDSMQTISADAFADCRSLKRIALQEGVTRVDSLAFAGCVSLKQAYLPDSLTTIGYNVFKDTGDLTIHTKRNTRAYGYALENGIDVELTGEYLLDFLFSYVDGGVELEEYRGGSAHLYIPAQVQGYPVLSIGSAAFENNRLLRGVTIAEGIRSIDTHAFAGCEGLRKVDLPETLTDIGEGAFANSGLTELVIPGGVSRIGTAAFSDCKKLVSVQLPSLAGNIGSSLFDGCVMLENVRFDGAPAVIFDKMFKECDALEKILIPAGVTRIGSGAFYGCEALREVRIPTSVTSIDGTAFALCTYPPVIYGAAGSAAQTAAAAAGLRFSTEEYFKRAGFRYSVSGDSATILGYDGYDTELIIPAELDGYRVVSIAERAFENHTKLTAVTMESVESIGAHAFSGCSSLAEMTCGNNLHTIGAYAFAGTAFRKMTLPVHVTSVGAYAFSGCTSLESVILLHTTINIGEDVFSGCDAVAIYGHLGSAVQQYAVANGYPYYALDDGAQNGYTFAIEGDSAIISGYTGSDDVLVLPVAYNGMPVTGIGAYAFYGHQMIRQMIIPDSVKTIGAAAFAGCAALESVDLPDELHTIEDCAFQECISLEEIAIPEGTVALGVSIFLGCENLRRIEVPSSVISFNNESLFVGNGGKTMIFAEPGSPVIAHAEKYDLEYFCIGIEDAILPEGDLPAGDSFAFGGMLVSSQPLSEVWGVITDLSDGQMKLTPSWKITSGAMKFNLTSLSTIGMRNLPLGRYCFDIYAKSILPCGTELRLLGSTTFRVVAADLRFACIGGYQNPGAYHVYGTAYQPKGELFATKYISSAYVTCVNRSTNETVRSETFTPEGRRTIAMRDLHKGLDMERLDTGEYEYSIMATVDDREYTVQSSKFRVIEMTGDLDPELANALVDFCTIPENVSCFERYSGDYMEVLSGISKWDELVIGAGASNAVLDSLVGAIKGYPGGSQAFVVKLYEKRLIQTLQQLEDNGAMKVPEIMDDLQEQAKKALDISYVTNERIREFIQDTLKVAEDAQLIKFLKKLNELFECIDVVIEFAPDVVRMFCVSLGDYQRFVLTLEMLQDAMGEDADPKFEQAVQNLYMKYYNGAVGLFVKLIDYLAGEKIKEVSQVILELCGAGSMTYKTAALLKDFLCEFSGVQDASDAGLAFVTQMNMVFDFKESYRQDFIAAQEEIIRGEVDPATLERVYFMYDATRTALIDLYDIMLEDFSKEHSGSVGGWKRERSGLVAMAIE